MRIINYISYYIIRIIRWKCNNVFLSLFRFLPKMTKRCAILSKRAPISPCRNISMSFSFHKKKIRHAILFPKKKILFTDGIRIKSTIRVLTEKIRHFRCHEHIFLFENDF